MSQTADKKDSLDFFLDYYFDAKSPVAFISPLALYREAKTRYLSLTFLQVKTWLQSKDTHSLHKPVRHNFPRNRVIVTGIDDQWQADLVDISYLGRFNKGINFYSPALMYFRNLLGSYHLKQDGRVNDFQSILDLGRSPEKLQTDKGTEFLNCNFQSLLKENSIHSFTTNSELKVSVVERFSRTLKTHMRKYFTAKNTRVYIDILQDIVHGYNNSYRSIGRAQVSTYCGSSEKKIVWEIMDEPRRELKFKLGDQVRISKSRRTFKKGYPPSWTQERTCEAKALADNSSFIFTVCVKSVPLYHSRLAYVVLHIAVKEFFQTHF